MTEPTPNAKIRVMLVDDSAVSRSVLRRVLDLDSRIELVTTARDGREAIEQARKHPLDIILLDVEMPEMDGLTALPLLRQARPEARVIMSSSLTQEGASTTMLALSLGAVAYFSKPTSGDMAKGLRSLADDLCTTIVACAPRPTGDRSMPKPQESSPTSLDWTRKAKLMIIASSTGGPPALDTFFSELDRDVETPILIAQHMPPVFTGHLADQLARASGRPCREAGDGEPILPGEILVAPGDYHLEVEQRTTGLYTRLHQGPKVNFVRPAADRLFQSAVDAIGGDLVSLVLTGMGEDGKTGAMAVHSAGGLVLVQDEESSVVWGMPGAVSRAGVAHAELPLRELAQAAARVCKSAVLG